MLSWFTPPVLVPLLLILLVTLGALYRVYG